MVYFSNWEEADKMESEFGETVKAVVDNNLLIGTDKKIIPIAENVSYDVTMGMAMLNYTSVFLKELGVDNLDFYAPSYCLNHAVFSNYIGFLATGDYSVHKHKNSASYSLYAKNISIDVNTNFGDIYGVLSGLKYDRAEVTVCVNEEAEEKITSSMYKQIFYALECADVKKLCFVIPYWHINSLLCCMSNYIHLANGLSEIEFHLNKVRRKDLEEYVQSINRRTVVKEGKFKVSTDGSTILLRK